MLGSHKFDPSENVEIIFQEPVRAYEIIAIVEANGSIDNNYTQVLNKAKEKAQQIGAHAIIPMQQENDHVPRTTAMIGQTPVVVPGGKKITVKVVALRYINED